MRRIILIACITIFSIPCFAQNQDNGKKLQEGIDLHEKGDYSGAIKLYDQIISLDSNYSAAYYEKSYSLYKAGKLQECIAMCRLFLDKFPGDETASQVFVTYGSALDGLGKPSEAMAIYTEGILKFPDSYMLHFNRGITAFQSGKKNDASNDFKNSLSINPFHASSHQALAYTQMDNNKIAATMALSVFLLLEPEGARAVKNLALLNHLLGSNVTQKDEKNISINLSSKALDTSNSGEDNFGGIELMISMQSALDLSEKGKDLTAAEKLKKKLELFSSAGVLKKPAKGFFTEFYLPFFSALKSDDKLLTACHLINASSTEEANKKWLSDHEKEITDFYTWLKKYTW